MLGFRMEVKTWAAGVGRGGPGIAVDGAGSGDVSCWWVKGEAVQSQPRKAGSKTSDTKTGGPCRYQSELSLGSLGVPVGTEPWVPAGTNRH